MADQIKTIPAEQIIADAELVAVFLRSLLAQNIPLSSAVSLASSYIQTTLFTRINQERPKDPWEGGPHP